LSNDIQKRRGRGIVEEKEGEKDYRKENITKNWKKTSALVTSICIIQKTTIHRKLTPS
jgi:hypothetical protein